MEKVSCGLNFENFIATYFSIIDNNKFPCMCFDFNFEFCMRLYFKKVELCLSGSFGTVYRADWHGSVSTFCFVLFSMA